MPVKPGFRTTEFWVQVVISLVNLLNLSGVWDFAPDRYSVISATIAAAAYAVSRGLAKRPTPIAVPVQSVPVQATTTPASGPQA